MKLFYTFCFLSILSTTTLFSQVGIGTTTPDPGAMLDISSSTDGINHKGFMPPRVASTTERDAIPTTSSNIGLLVFVQSSNCLQIWNGINWEDVHCLNASTASNNVWINEFHYDNSGSSDVGEFVEIAGTAGIDLTGYTLFFTNGALGNVYQTINLSGTIPDDGSGFGTISFTPSFSIQNGGADGDGIALIDPNNIILQNLSYEDTFTINEPGNVLNGLSTTIIGVVETNTTPAGESLQLIGTGNVLLDFTWSGPIVDTPGTVNTGQTFN